MSVLNKLKFVSCVRTAKSQENPTLLRRSKIIKRIEEQIALVQAEIEGRKLVVTQRKTKINKQTGERSIVEREKHFKQWYWTVDGKLMLEVRYGAQPLELSKGKNAVQLADRSDLLATLELFSAAAKTGELDAPIAAVCTAKFPPKQKSKAA